MYSQATGCKKLFSNRSNRREVRQPYFSPLMISIYSFRTLPGSSPSRIQGYTQEEWHQRMRKVKGERKSLDLPWFTQKANKAPDTELALFTEAAGALSVG